MKFVSSQLAYFLSEREQRSNVRALLRYLLILLLIMLVFTVIFHLLMIHVEEQRHDQRHLAAKNTLDAARADALSALAPDWRLPHGADWHRKYHLLRAHLADGADPAALTRDTLLAGVKIGSWLHRQLSTWHALHPGQQQLMTALGLTPESNPLAPARRTRRTFEQTVQLLELFLHREGRVPGAREEIRVDGETVRIGAWLAKARTRHRSGQLDAGHGRLVSALFDGDWTDEATAPATVAPARR
jgi:hypothetical protein